MPQASLEKLARLANNIAMQVQHGATLGETYFQIGEFFTVEQEAQLVNSVEGVAVVGIMVGNDGTVLILLIVIIAITCLTTTGGTFRGASRSLSFHFVVFGWRRNSPTKEKREKREKGGIHEIVEQRSRTIPQWFSHEF